MKKQVRDLYVYAYPIVGMYELLYTQVLDREKKKTGFLEFAHTCELATSATDFVPAPNNDTTYSRAFLDLRNGPVILNAPDTDGRYYCVQLLDMTSETVLNLGKRLHGTKAQRFAIMEESYCGSLPDDVIPVRCRTLFVLAFLRVLIGSEKEIPEVRAIQNAFSFLQLNGKEVEGGQGFPVYKNGTYREFFETALAVLHLSTGTEFDQKKKQEIEKLLEISDDIVIEGCKEARCLIEEEGMKFGEEVNYWRIARTGIGIYKKDYLQRAVVWHKGALANVPEESLYPSTFQDSEGELLDGKNQYRFTFKTGELPPVSQFWSVTMYIFRNARLAKNRINRYSIGDRNEGLKYGEDGSLTIYLQQDEPKNEAMKSNWLPAPDEKFYITLRLYGPSKEAIHGIWKPPYVERVK